MGLSSAGVANAYEKDRIDKQTSAFYTQVRADMTDELIKALRAGDDKRVQEIQDARDAWNQQYPDMPISLSPTGIRRGIAQAGMRLDERTMRLLPRNLRGTSLAYEGISEGQ